MQRSQKQQNLTLYISDIITELTKIFNSTNVLILTEKPVAKLLTLLPLYAKCKNHFELSITKLSIYYIVAFKIPEKFYQKPQQDIRERISIVTTCPDGDNSIINLITDFLEMISINDHLEDYYADLADQRYNPLFDQMGYYLNRKSELKENIENFSDQDLVSELISICNPFKMSWWG